MKNTASTKIILSFFFFSVLTALNCQAFDNKACIHGVVLDVTDRLPIPFYHIALLNADGLPGGKGGIGSETGEFLLCVDGHRQTAEIQLSAVGYETLVLSLVTNGSTPDTLFMRPSILFLSGVEITARQVRASGDGATTVYQINSSMKQASHTASDVLRLLPGMGVDFRQNIQLEGSEKVLILVNGMERDQEYLRQLDAGALEKVEISNTPPVGYEGNYTGTIHVILRNEQKRGWSGHILAETPSLTGEVYMFPGYSLHYGSGKLNLFTSYNGEISHFDLEENQLRILHLGERSDTLLSVQSVRQKNWSHRFHLGGDIEIGKKSQLSFYSWFNPFSQKHNGYSRVGFSSHNEPVWEATKEDMDKNQAGFYSLFFRHQPKEGHSLVIEAARYQLKADNVVHYSTTGSLDGFVNQWTPRQNTWRLKTEYAFPMARNMVLTTGVHATHRGLENQATEDFHFTDRFVAVYSRLVVQAGNVEVNLGIQAETGHMEQSGISRFRHRAISPQLMLGLPTGDNGNFRFALQRSVERPGVYQLTMHARQDDPFSIQLGNASLRPTINDLASLTYSHRLENHFFNARLFYTINRGVMQDLMHLSDEGVFETQRHNLGNMQGLGMQFSGSFGLLPGAGINPNVRIYRMHTRPGQMALDHGIENRSATMVEGELSAYASLGRGFVASLMVRYSNPVMQIQGNRFEDTFYFLSLEKTFSGGLQAGIVMAMPMAKTADYQGHDILGADFSSHYAGTIQLSAFPCWFKLSYRFNRGSDSSRQVHRPDDLEQIHRKGF